MNFTKTAVQIEAIDAETLLSRFASILDAKIGSAIATALARGMQPQQQPADDLLSRNDVAKLFKISTDTVDNWSKVGILNPYRRGRRVFFKRSEVEFIPIPQSANRLNNHKQIKSNNFFNHIVC